ncbi:MAG: phage tail protein [Chloroflexota bacterium]
MDSEAIGRLLPGVFQTALHPVAAGVVEPDRRLAALLDVMETLHAPVESVLGGLDHYLDPRLATPAFVPYLAGWVDLDWLLVADPSAPMAATATLASGLGTLRELVAAAAELARWRGTARGLLRFLDTATGVPGFAIEENVTGDDRKPRPFHLRIVGPAGAEKYRPLIERVIVAEKPAYATYELVFAMGPMPTPASAPGRRFPMTSQPTATIPATAR